MATYVEYLNAFDDVDAYSDDGSNIRVIDQHQRVQTRPRPIGWACCQSAFALLA